MDPVTFFVGSGAAAAMGKAIEMGIEGLAELWEEAEEEVPKDHRTNPRPEFAGPLLEDAKYHGDSGVLRKTFRRLLSTGMDERTQHLAHPAFVQILGQLSADEAVLLKYLKDSIEPRGNAVIWRFWKRDEVGAPWGKSEIKFSGDVREIERMAFPENIEMYVSHLEHLGLLESVEAFVESDKAHIEEDGSGPGKVIVQEPHAKQCDIRLSDFGAKFVDAAIPEDL